MVKNPLGNDLDDCIGQDGYRSQPSDFVLRLHVNAPDKVMYFATDNADGVPKGWWVNQL